MRRAYRRPVTERGSREADGVLSQGAGGGGFEAGIEAALSAVLVSPEFLFRIEQDPAGHRAERGLSRSAIWSWRRGSRSFCGAAFPMMNCSTPADRGELHKTEGAGETSAAHAGGSRARRTGHAISPSNGCTCATWNRSRRTCGSFPISTTICARPSGAKRNCIFESVLREDRSVLDLLKADYTFLNERLAKHYGIPNVYGSRFRRVALGRGQRTRRSAAPGQRSHGDVLRHAHVAGDSRQMDSRKSSRHAAAAAAARRAGAEGQHRFRQSLRCAQRLAEHRANAACASCHDLMDPIGFSLENFDAMGRWRDAGGWQANRRHRRFAGWQQVRRRRRAGGGLRKRRSFSSAH